MIAHRLVFLVCAALVCTACVDRALSDTFGSGTDTFDIEFVTIGNPGNAPDTTGDPNPAGSVAEPYRIGKFEISEQMIDKANALGGLGISTNARGPDKPATLLTWLDAARFVNWLNTSSGSTSAYKFNGSSFELWVAGDAGFNPTNRYRNSSARYFLPSVDEWHKAAYYDPTTGNYFDFPTGINTAPTAVASGTAADSAVFDQPFEQGPADITLAGGLSPNGTMAQGGNVWELEETDLDLVNDSTSSARGMRGGNWLFDSSFLSASARSSVDPEIGVFTIGFRVASIAIPEPSSLLLGAFAGISLLWRSRAL